MKMPIVELNVRSKLEASYDGKPASYFSDARQDIVTLLQTGAESAIIELGCGSGGTGRAVMAAGKAGRYVGIELSQTAAKVAAESFAEVLVGDVDALDLSHLQGAFDALIISEVLEHLVDPWTALERLVACLKPGGVVFASSPNVAQFGVIKGLIMGRFDYKEMGVMDRTHLRWFTPNSYRTMFEAAGVEVEDLRPIRAFGGKARVVNALTRGRFQHLFMTQIMIVGRLR